jgi:hypothetical protein
VKNVIILAILVVSLFALFIPKTLAEEVGITDNSVKTDNCISFEMLMHIAMNNHLIPSEENWLVGLVTESNVLVATYVRSDNYCYTYVTSTRGIVSQEIIHQYPAHTPFEPARSCKLSIWDVYLLLTPYQYEYGIEVIQTSVWSPSSWIAVRVTDPNFVLPRWGGNFQIYEYDDQGCLTPIDPQ